MAEFNVNTDELVSLTNKLEKLHKSAMPIAVRGTLNDAAFEARKESIKIFKSNFTIRKETFHQSHIIVNKSPNTFNLKEMYSENGVIKNKSGAGNRLEHLEHGRASIKRTVPSLKTRDNIKKARILAKYYWKKFKDKPLGHIPTQRGKKVSRRPNKTFIKTKKRLYVVDKFGKWETLYYIDENVTIKRDEFLVPAAIKTSKKLNRLYQDRAKKQFARLMN